MTWYDSIRIRVGKKIIQEHGIFFIFQTLEFDYSLESWEKNICIKKLGLFHIQNFYTDMIWYYHLVIYRGYNIYIYEHILPINFLTKFSFLWVLCLKKVLKYVFFPQNLKSYLHFLVFFKTSLGNDTQHLICEIFILFVGGPRVFQNSKLKFNDILKSFQLGFVRRFIT